MPWTDAEAPQHTKKATTPGLKRLWAKVANAALKKYGDDARAVREANAAVDHARGRMRII